MVKRLGLFAKLAFLSVLIFLVISVVQMNIRIRDLREDEEALKQQLLEGQLNVEEMNGQLGQELDEELIKKIAREKLNLRDPGDIIFASDLPN